MAARRLDTALLLAAAMSACTGQIGEATAPTPGAPTPGARPTASTEPRATPTPTPSPSPSPSAPGHPQPVTFACDAAAPSTTPTPLRRLSILQLRNTLRDLFDGVVDPMTAASAAIASLPADDTGTGFRSMDARLSERHVQAFYDIADSIATSVTTDDAKLRALGTSCALAMAPTAACVDAFLDGFAVRAYRRPLSSDERARYHALVDGTRDGRELFRALTFSVLMAPQFLYHTEIEGSAIDQAHFELGPYELAARLSYHFWQSMPDAALFAAAEDGSLLTEPGYAAAVARVFADPRTQQTIAAFYAEWFEVGAIPDFRRGPAWPAFVAGSGLEDSAAEREYLRAASDEIMALTSHYTWEVDGRFQDLLLSDVSLTRSPELARVYGVPAWDGQSEPPRLPASERAGLLTRVSFLLSGTHATHPIHRGAIIRKRMLCDTLAAPDPNSLPPGSLVPPPADPTQTTRERFANKVATEPCASCHAQMNPIGYVLERYDALGRHRLTEQVFDEATGAAAGTLPIDSSATPRITAEDATNIDSGVALSRLVADSGKVEACFARQYFRFTNHRLETAQDGCSLEAVLTAVASGTLKDALVAIAMSPSFKTRKVE